MPPIISVCLACIFAANPILSQEIADAENIIPPQIQRTDTGISGFELKFDADGFLVRRKGTSKWERSSKVNEPIAVGLLDGTQKVYLDTKAIRPKALHTPAGEYPESERRSHIQGQVSLSVVV